MINYPIIIPFKEHSERCQQKNFILFPFVMAYLVSIGVTKSNIYVTSDSSKVKKFVEPYGVNFIFENKTISHDEAIASYLVAKQLKVDWYFMLPITQPLRSKDILTNMINEIDNQYSFITTYIETHNRNIFELDDNSKFKIENEHHTGKQCPIVKMIDGSIYLINSKFIETLLKSNDINRDFWHSNFKAIEHKSVICDIDTKNQLEAFLNIVEQF